MGVAGVSLELGYNDAKKITEEIGLQPEMDPIFGRYEHFKDDGGEQQLCQFFNNPRLADAASQISVLKLKAIFSNYSYSRETIHFLRSHPLTVVHQATKMDAQFFSVVTMAAGILMMMMMMMMWALAAPSLLSKGVIKLNHPLTVVHQATKMDAQFSLVVTMATGILMMMMMMMMWALAAPSLLSKGVIKLKDIDSHDFCQSFD
jgi:hypothetical protein